jgi:hypothetical protein
VNFLVSDRWVFRGPLWPVADLDARTSGSRGTELR